MDTNSHRLFDLIGLALFCLTTLFLTEFSSAMAQEPLKLTLQDSLSYCQKNNESLKIAQEEVEIAEAKVAEALSQMLPKVSSQNSYAYFINPLVILDEKTLAQIRASFRDIVPTDLSSPLESEPERVELDPHDFRISATLQQPLFTWGKLMNNHRQAKLNLQATQESLESVKQQLTFEATQAFYGALLAKELVKVSEDSLKQVERHLKLASDLQSAGRAISYEVLRASVQLANNRYELIRSQNAFRLALEELKIKVGLDFETEVELEGSYEYKPLKVEFDQLLKSALEGRSDLEQMKLQSEAAKSLVKVAKAENKPSLVLLSSYEADQSGKWSSWRQTKSSWNIVLALNLPIFDGFLTRAKVKQAKSRLNQTQLRRSQLESKIRLEVKSAYLFLMEAKSLIETQKKTVEQAQEGLRVANLQYENGAITSVQLIDSQLALTQAQVNRLQASHDYAIAVARLEKATGGRY